MIMFRRVLVALLIAALPLVLAAPASTTLLSVRDSQVEQWIIKTMNVHFMGESTGIVGTKWPAGSEFNSTIDFELLLPQYKALCNTTWTPDIAHPKLGTLPSPTTTFACGPAQADVWIPGESVRFGLKTYEGLGLRRPETSFTVMVWRDGADGRRFYGEANITGNGYITEPSSYLTCMTGRPYDGVRCGMHGLMSNAQDIVIDVQPLEDSMRFRKEERQGRKPPRECWRKGRLMCDWRACRGPWCAGVE